MWVGSMILEYVYYIPMGPRKLGIFVYYSYMEVELGKLGGVLLLALCIEITIHRRNIHKKHCSSQYYSLELLLISTLSLKI